MTQRFVLVESPTSGTGGLVLGEVRKLGYVPTILAANPERYRDVSGQGAAEVVRVDTSDLGAMLDACRAMGGMFAVGTAYEFFAQAASRLASALGLAGPSPGAVDTCRSKNLTRRALRREAPGLNPVFHEIKDEVDLEAACAKLDIPFIVKLVDSAGGGGVHKVSSREEALRRGKELLEMDAYGGRATQRTILAEQMMVGDEFSVECQDGSAISVTMKMKGGEDDLTELGHCVPADLEAEDRRRVCEAAERALRTVRLTFGPAHVEVFVTAGGPKIVEINPRLAGDQIPLLVELATGFPYVESYVRGLLRLKPGPWDRLDRYASIQFSLLESTVMVEEMRNAGRIAEMPNIVGAGNFATLGQVCEYLGNNRNRLGWAIAVAGSSEEAIRSARTAVEDLEFRLS